MNASAHNINNSLFKSFIPLNSFDQSILEKLARHATVRHCKSGNVLFERGDDNTQTIFLLEGEIELHSPLSQMQKVSAGSETSRYPLAHSLPRQFTAVCVTNVNVLVLPLDILEIMPSEAKKGNSTSSSAHSDAWKTQWLNSPMLRNLPDANKKALLSKMEEIRVQAGQVIIHQEEPADSYFVIKQGKCSVSRRPAPGTRDVKLAELTEGQGFGEEALITNIPRNASVSMLSDGVLLRLSKQDFIGLLARPLLHHLPFQNAIELVEQGAVLIDVRAPEEFEIDGLIGSINMPLPVLRLKANRLHRDHTYVVYSNTGHFSSVAAFLLIQQGLKAYVLLGGLSTVPKNRMKDSTFINNDHTSETQDTTPAVQNKILTFPQNNDVQHSGTSDVHRQDRLVTNEQPQEVDWNLISDDVLWRSTISHRKDPGIEAAISANPIEAEISANPTDDRKSPIDASIQGFDDIKLFTTINALKDIKIGGSEGQKQGTGYSQPASYKVRNADKTPSHYQEPQNWNHRTTRRPSKRLIFTTIAILLFVGTGLGFYYFSSVAHTSKTQETSPKMLEQQRKLNDKLSRLLDAIDSMSTHHTQDSKSNDVDANNATQTSKQNIRKTETSDSSTQNQIIRKESKINSK